MFIGFAGNPPKNETTELLDWSTGIPKRFASSTSGSFTLMLKSYKNSPFESS